ncbi:hypothetical protein KIN20_035900 [Parelaphostrongylus tenuis]|uniref:Uncharacterized protein n=1 Tax=Parelaphostrongylus tenuis TaxID=148309 RepID=A0AAD5WKX5_PARTN|nr:hypothetical protein KIN20_035900 [Parelaphostrongylus tenuis]
MSIIESGSAFDKRHEVHRNNLGEISTLPILTHLLQIVTNGFNFNRSMIAKWRKPRSSMRKTAYSNTAPARKEMAMEKTYGQFIQNTNLSAMATSATFSWFSELKKYGMPDDNIHIRGVESPEHADWSLYPGAIEVETSPLALYGSTKTILVCIYSSFNMETSHAASRQIGKRLPLRFVSSSTVSSLSSSVVYAKCNHPT